MGARLVLSDAWYNANIANFSPIDQAVLTALNTYGGIVSDLASNGLWISGVNDERWNLSDLNAAKHHSRLGIPGSQHDHFTTQLHRTHLRPGRRRLIVLGQLHDRSGFQFFLERLSPVFRRWWNDMAFGQRGDRQ